MNILTRSFYNRDPADVAHDLLGKLIHRNCRGTLLIGKIVETEAYYSTADPASRAFSGKQTPLTAPMWDAPGTILVYMVHNNWLFNIVTLPEGTASAVLIRAVEPIENASLQLKNRQKFNAKISHMRDVASGPGKFTQAFAIDKGFNRRTVLTKNELWVAAGNDDRFEINRSHRIGVRRDLPVMLRFAIEGNPFVSKA